MEAGSCRPPETTNYLQSDRNSAPDVQAFFLGVPFLVAGTNRVAMLQEHIAHEIANRPDLRVLECPFEAVPLVEALWWHPVYDQDIEHLWLRQRFAEAIAEQGLTPPIPEFTGAARS
jgi:hypothetical protein